MEVVSALPGIIGAGVIGAVVVSAGVGGLGVIGAAVVGDAMVGAAVVDALQGIGLGQLRIFVIGAAVLDALKNIVSIGVVGLGMMIGAVVVSALPGVLHLGVVGAVVVSTAMIGTLQDSPLSPSPHLSISPSSTCSVAIPSLTAPSTPGDSSLHTRPALK